MEIKKIILVLFLLLIFSTKVNTQKSIIQIPKAQIENVEPTFFINIKKYIGLKYYWGSKNPKYGLDCSGLTYNIYKDNNIKIPFGSYQQVGLGKVVSFSQLQYGDLLFFKIKKRKVSHVAIYLSDCVMHSVKRGVVIDSIASQNFDFYKKYLVVIKRIEKRE